MTPEETYDLENHAVLLRMLQGGDTLTKSRDVNFSVVFENEGNALAFVKQLQEQGYSAAIEDDGNSSLDVTVVKNMTPTFEGIGQVEAFLALSAGPLAGRNDGWFCERIMDDPAFSQTSRESHP